MMKKKIITPVIILAIVAALVCILPLPVKIDTTLSGIRWENGNSDYSEDAEITVRGTYYRYLFRDNTFKGEISVSGLEGMEFGSSSKLRLANAAEVNAKYGSLLYYSNKKNAFAMAGSIAVDGAFNGIVILLNENTYGEYQIITAPAADRETAVGLAADIMGELWRFN